MVRTYLPPVCIALMMLISAVAYAFLPDMMIVHWNFSLQPDGYTRKSVAVLVLPIIGLGLICMQLVGRYVAGQADVRARFGPAVVFVMPILLLAHAGMIAIALMSASRI